MPPKIFTTTITSSYNLHHITKNIDVVIEFSYLVPMQMSNVSGKDFMKWRETMGWTRKWLSMQIGCGESALYKWEHSDYIPHMAERATAAVKANLPSIISPATTKGE